MGQHSAAQFAVYCHHDAPSVEQMLEIMAISSTSSASWLPYHAVQDHQQPSRPETTGLDNLAKHKKIEREKNKRGNNLKHKHIENEIVFCTDFLLNTPVPPVPGTNYPLKVPHNSLLPHSLLHCMVSIMLLCLCANFFNVISANVMWYLYVSYHSLIFWNYLCTVQPSQWKRKWRDWHVDCILCISSGGL